MRIKLLYLLLFPLAAFGQIRWQSGASLQSVTVGSGIRLTVPDVQPETSAWIASVLANGGTYNATDVRAVDYFVRETKAKGLWPLFDWVALFVGRNLNAALVPLKRTIGDPVMTNNNFVEADFSPTVGLTGNGSTKRLLPGLNRSQCRAANDVSLGAYVTGHTTTASLAGIIGTSTANSFHVFLQAGHQIVASRCNTNTVVLSSDFGAPVNGLCAVSRGQPDPGTIYVFHGSGENSSTQGSAVASAVLAVFARDNSDFFDGALGGAWFGGGFTTSQRADLVIVWNQTMTILGRPTP